MAIRDAYKARKSGLQFEVMLLFIVWFFLGVGGSEKLALGRCLQALGPSLAQEEGISTRYNNVTRNLVYESG